jgi:hypothetical protein
MEFYKVTLIQYTDYIKKQWVYIPVWPDNIKILIPKEFGKELNRYPELVPQVLFLTKGEYNCSR